MPQSVPGAKRTSAARPSQPSRRSSAGCRARVAPDLPAKLQETRAHAPGSGTAPDSAQAATAPYHAVRTIFLLWTRPLACRQKAAPSAKSGNATLRGPGPALDAEACGSRAPPSAPKQFGRAQRRLAHFEQLLHRNRRFAAGLHGVHKRRDAGDIALVLT